MKTPLITIGIVFGKNDLKYLTYTLKSVFEQTYVNFEVIMHNNVLNEDDLEEDDKVWQWIEENYPKVKLERSGNIGFGPAHNVMIRQMQGDYYLCYNPDIILEPGFLEQLISFIKERNDEKIGVIGGRLMYWDFAKRDDENLGKTEQIDSLGLKLKKTHRVIDLGQGEQASSFKLQAVRLETPLRGQGGIGEAEVTDSGQARKTNNAQEVFGLSGALFLASKHALQKVAYNLKKEGKVYQEFFDETIFLYKEDVDLAYRLRLAGFKTFVLRDAVAYHDRSVEGNTGIIGSRKSKKRVAKGQTINTWSFYHHHIMLYKNWQKGFSWKVKLATFFYELASNLYLLVFETSTFWHGWKLFKQNFTEIKKRKQMTLKKKSAREIEKWMG